MSELTLSRPALPAWYVTGRERGAIVVALPSVFEQVTRLVAASGSLFDGAAAMPDAVAFTGRGAAYCIALGDERCVVRHYRRGGAIAPILGDRYLRVGASRAAQELRVSAAARARGVDTPEILACVEYPAGVFYRADVMTRYVPHSIDLATAALDPRHAGALDRSAAWHAAGVLMGAAFRAGVEHADLNMRNILIASEGDVLRAHLIDMDRAVLRDGAVGESARAAMVARLHRSRRKLEMAFGMTAGRSELAAFDEGLRGA